MPISDDGYCDRCFYYDVELGDGDVELDHGHCHRFPPVVGDRGSDEIASLPLVHADSWCGEWKPVELGKDRALKPESSAVPKIPTQGENLIERQLFYDRVCREAFEARVCDSPHPQFTGVITRHAVAWRLMDRFGLFLHQAEEPPEDLGSVVRRIETADLSVLAREEAKTRKSGSKIRIWWVEFAKMNEKGSG